MPESIQRLIDRLGRGRSALIVLTGVLAVIAILAVARWASSPDWVPLFPGMSLDDVGEVTAKLDEEGVRYELSRGGAEVLVADDALARARVALAAEGLPARGRPGFELFDRPSWGMTDFTQRINYRRALEGELERTIGRMRGVEAAQVHIALNESGGFRRGSQPEAASVVLSLGSGFRPGAELVEGITSLVASSVDGLGSDQVTVLDDGGHLLSAAVEPGSADGLTKRQLQLRRDVEAYLEQKAEDLIAQAVGPGNARVRVAAELNFDRVDRTTQTVDPDALIATREERTEITPSEGQVGAASSATSATYETTRSVETFSGAAGTVRRLTVAVMLNERTPVEDGAPATPWTGSELSRLETLVSNAVGLDPGRGDLISITAVPFAPVAVPPATPVVGPSVFVQIREYRNDIITGVALLLAFIIGMQVLRALRATAAAGLGLTRGEGASATLGAGAVASGSVGAGPHAGVLVQSAANPESTARVLRAMMKES